MGGPGVLIHIGTHGLLPLVQVGKLPHKAGVPGDEAPVRAADVAADGGLIIGGVQARVLQGLSHQGGHIGLAHVGARAGDKQRF